MRSRMGDESSILACCLVAESRSARVGASSAMAGGAVCVQSQREERGKNVSSGRRTVILATAYAAAPAPTATVASAPSLALLLLLLVVVVWEPRSPLCAAVDALLRADAANAGRQHARWSSGRARLEVDAMVGEGASRVWCRECVLLRQWALCRCRGRRRRQQQLCNVICTLITSLRRTADDGRRRIQSHPPSWWLWRQQRPWWADDDSSRMWAD
jgi:hypothetical protein